MRFVVVALFAILGVVGTAAPADAWAGCTPRIDRNSWQISWVCY
jgi:hypothetical protein